MQLDKKQSEIFRELINIGVGRAGSTLNQLLSSHVDLNVPKISIFSIQEYINHQNLNNDVFSAVEMGFRGPFSGAANLLFSQKSAAQLTSALVGDELESYEMHELKSGTLSKVGNILLNSVMGSISNIINDHFDYSVAEYREGTFENLIHQSFQDTKVLIMAETNFHVSDMEINGQIVIMMSLESFEILEKSINNLI